MKPHRPTAGNGVHRTPGILLALVSAITLVAIVACSGDEPPPTDRPDRSQPQLEQTIEAMDTEIAALQTETAESQGTAAGNRQTANTQPTPANSTQTPPPTEAPSQAVIQSPNGPGICGRSPQIQKALLYSLEVNLCQVITNAELFRVTSMSDLTIATPKPGDFDGLVNVQSLKLNTKDIAPGTFLGLNNLKSMELNVYTYGSLPLGAFQGLNSLDSLKITSSKPESSHEDTLALPDFDPMPNLTHLQVDYIPTLYIETTTESLLQNLPALEQLTIRLNSNQQDETKEATATLPSGLFAHNPNLTTINFTVHSLSNVAIEFPKDLFAENTNLQTLNISGNNYELPTTIFGHLDQLEDLTLERNRDKEKPELELSKTSPLYNKIVYGRKGTSGYTLAGQQDN